MGRDRVHYLSTNKIVGKMTEFKLLNKEPFTEEYVLSELRDFYSGNKHGRGGGYGGRLLRSYIDQQTNHLQQERDTTIGLVRECYAHPRCDSALMHKIYLTLKQLNIQL